MFVSAKRYNEALAQIHFLKEDLKAQEDLVSVREKNLSSMQEEITGLRDLVQKLKKKVLILEQTICDFQMLCGMAANDLRDRAKFLSEQNTQRLASGPERDSH